MANSKRFPSRCGRIFIVITAILAGLTPFSTAQKGTFQEGQPIQYYDRLAGKWEQGTYRRATPGDEQPIIWKKAGDPNSETAYSWDMIKAADPAPPPGAEPPKGGPGKYQPGQKIWYRVGTTWPPQWEQGTYVGQTPDGKQPIIRRKPDQFYPGGFETAYTWEDVKDAPPENATQRNAPIPVRPQPAPGDAPKPNPQPGTDTPAAAGGPPLMEEEILKFLQDRLGDNPFADALRLQQAKDDLGALIKKRGTAFRHNSAISPFAQKVSAFGMTSEVIGPLGKNFGPPNARDWLFGTFVTAKTGLPITYREGDRLMQWSEVGSLNTGTVTINPDGTYVWDTDSAQGVIRGKWHAATPAESGDHGGAGVILEKAKSGTDWHAYKYRAGNPLEEWLGLDNLPERSIREGAMRVPK